MFCDVTMFVEMVLQDKLHEELHSVIALKFNVKSDVHCICDEINSTYECKL